ncbi:hypothetical protein L6164_026737 [Bauhinia variegata]|uniref:Uncharacterized protein n=1 Tax=Bauhinia variegata TaxID=167791 RepID=A0ACB9LRA7_BAUVA|nr:hypothetical protein L6164_026737 [Bauhinia variegata]
MSVNSDHVSFIQRRLQELFNSFHTPYAMMRQRAVRDLNEATESRKETISEFIRREYKDLPLAQMTILGLRKLHDAGELLCTERGRYRVDNGNLGAVEDINKALEESEDVERENGLPGQENEKQTGVSVTGC